LRTNFKRTVGYPSTSWASCNNSNQLIPDARCSIQLESRHIVYFILCIQHRFTRLIPRMQKVTYMECLAKLNRWSLEERRNRSDLIEVFKMAKNLSPIPLMALTKFFELNTDNRTRGHSFKLVAPLQLRSPSSLLLRKSISAKTVAVNLSFSFH